MEKTTVILSQALEILSDFSYPVIFAPKDFLLICTHYLVFLLTMIAPAQGYSRYASCTLN